MSLTFIKQNLIAGSSVFFLQDTLGFPLAMSFIECAQRNYMIEWQSYIRAAKQQSRDASWIYRAINEAFDDSQVWQEIKNEILLRIRCLIKVEFKT